MEHVLPAIVAAEGPARTTKRVSEPLNRFVRSHRGATTIVMACILAACGSGSAQGEAVSRSNSTTTSTTVKRTTSSTQATTSTTGAASVTTCSSLKFPVCPLPAPRYFESELSALVDEASADTSFDSSGLQVYGVRYSDPDPNGNIWVLEQLEYQPLDDDKGCLTGQPGDPTDPSLGGTQIISEQLITVRGDTAGRLCSLKVAANMPPTTMVTWHEMDQVWDVAISEAQRSDGSMTVEPYSGSDLAAAVNAWTLTGTSPGL